MPVEKRAVTPTQRQERRQEVLDAAWQLYQERRYEDITVNEVAQAAGLAKGTVYLYFKTKEELFLAVQTQQLAAWFDELTRGLRLLVGSGNVNWVAGVVVDTLAARPAMARLLGMLHSVLEQNIEYEAAREFKQFLLERITKIGRTLEAALPFLETGQGIQAAMWIYAFVIGMHQVTEPAPVIRRVFENESSLQSFRLDFSAESRVALAAMLRGMERTE